MADPVPVITGGLGFLGWHLACRLRALDGVEPVLLGRDDFADGVERLGSRLDGVDTIYHLAGVNRGDPGDVERGNLAAAQTLADAVRWAGRPVHVIYANSIQADGESEYGRGKRGAAGVLRGALDQVGGTLADVILPNVFGEHGRPSYNSFVATFCHAVANGEDPVVHQDREVPLLHAQQAAEVLREAAATRAAAQVRPEGTPIRVTEVLGLLRGYHDIYASRGELPDLADPFEVDLFNTYRSYLFPQAFPMVSRPHDDERGRLFETARNHGGPGQSFVSITVPGATRGHHYHLSKVERFFVVSGEAEIALRRLLDDEVVRFRLSGDQPSYVDMPTLWVHSITNVGPGDLVTVFWSNQLLDPANPDQFPERVEEAAT